jgi:hypothetical protein
LDPRKQWYARQMTTQSQPRRMTVAEFMTWATAQSRGRYELVRGEVVAMAPEQHLSVPSIRHCLIVNPIKNVVVHHARGQGGDISTRIASSGMIDLTPPGMTIPVAELLSEVG